MHPPNEKRDISNVLKVFKKYVITHKYISIFHTYSYNFMER
jgi:hypothetical protein